MTDIVLEFALPGPAWPAIANALVLRCWFGAPPGWHRVGIAGAWTPGGTVTVALRDERGRQATLTAQVRELGPEPRAVLALSFDAGPLAGPPVVAELVVDGERVRLAQSGGDAEAWSAFWRLAFERLSIMLAGGVVSPYEELVNEAQAYHDPLGVAAWGVLAAMREAGAPAEELAGVEEAVYAWLGRLDAERGDMLDRVMRERVAVLDGWRAAT